MTGDLEHFAPTAWQLIAALKPKETHMADYADLRPELEADRAGDRLRREGKNLDYEQTAINALANAAESPPAAAALYLAEAQVWATLHHARVTA